MLQKPFSCAETFKIGISGLDSCVLYVKNSALEKIGTFTLGGSTSVNIQIMEEVSYKSTFNDYSLTILVIEDPEDKHFVSLKVDGVPCDWIVTLRNGDGTWINSILIDGESSDCVDLEVTP